MQKYALAQLNIGKLKAPIDDPMIAGFVNRLDEINTLAEESEGFIWRLKDDSGNATGFQVFPDPLIIPNMSVWASVEALKNFAFESHHLEVMRQRKKWFESMNEAYMVLWWIPIDHRPDLAEAKQKLELLQKNGSSAAAFDFRMVFLPPG